VELAADQQPVRRIGSRQDREVGKASRFGRRQILERMHDEIDATIEQRNLEFLREEAFLHAAREVRRLIDIAAGRDDRDLRIPRRRRADAAQRREHRA
jgi:hypothetical protein